MPIVQAAALERYRRLGCRNSCSKRLLQKVSTISKRVKVVGWTVNDANENGEIGVVFRTINQFPSEFRGKYNAKHAKCARWWKSRAEVGDQDKFNTKSISTVTGYGRRQTNIKAVFGRGRRRAQWVETLYDILLEEFSRLNAAGVKFSPALISIIARDIILSSAEFAVDFGLNYVDPSDGIKVIGKIKTRWVKQFMKANEIVTRV
ncbi:hypothetical protein CCR75_008992 [Bremia lactucae]|uniref:Uncharacterized protein n=1 Tax=Bremia lactucae TaxID=4779 RepID=A0A976FQI6_BRELC|nr:hypothetical protein CCR75_008992 [Bremia lactucae]